MLWQAFTADQPVVLLIDEIDKADIEFPNDLLRELDRMEFYVYETRELVKAKHRPLVFITSNNEKELPDAFLRRCFFHYIKFPDADTMKQIVDVHFPRPEEGAAGRGAEDLLRRAQPARPEEEAVAPRELLDWLKLLLAEDIPLEALQQQGRQGRRAAAGRRAAEERAGRDAVREAGVHAAAQPLSAMRDGRVEPVTLDVRPACALEPLGLQHARRPARRRRATASCGTCASPRVPDARRDARLHRARRSQGCDDGHMLPFAVRRRRQRHGRSARTQLPRHRARRRAARDRLHLVRARAASARTSTPPASCCCWRTPSRRWAAQLVGLAHRQLQLRVASARSSGWARSKDGVLRHHALRRDGTVRDTVMYSLPRASGRR